MLIHRCLLLTPFLFLTQNLCAQNNLTDTTYVSAATSNLKKHYFEERKSESLLFSGYDYADYEPVLDEHPFFLTDDWIFGEVRYNGSTYSNVPLQFDIHSQKLITEHSATGKKLELIQQNVSWFNLENHHFVSLNNRESKDKTPRGYYELLVDGQVKLFAGHSKAFQESTVTGKLVVRVEENKKYLVFKDDVFIPVKNKSTVLSALADKKTILAKEIKRNRINFSDKQKAMIETIRLYNSLPQL